MTKTENGVSCEFPIHEEIRRQNAATDHRRRTR